MMENSKVNPFSIVRASEYSPQEIESLWVSCDKDFDEIFMPNANKTVYIHGSKGCGKTHLLRYYSYRSIKNSMEEGYLAVFTRCGALQAKVFSESLHTKNIDLDMQSLFVSYFELHLIELILDSMILMRRNEYNDSDFIGFLSQFFYDKNITNNIKELEDLLSFFENIKKNLVMSITKLKSSKLQYLDYVVPFEVGVIYREVSNGLSVWAQKKINLIYVVDELEEMTLEHQEVLNSFVRTTNGLVSFRIAGRSGSLKTKNSYFMNIESEANSEFSYFNLDQYNSRRSGHSYTKFAEEFINKKIEKAGFDSFDIKNLFDSCSDLDENDFLNSVFLRLGIDSNQIFLNIRNSFRKDFSFLSEPVLDLVCELIFDDKNPLILTKLNVLLFVKQYRKGKNLIDHARSIKLQLDRFLLGQHKGRYKTAYSHYKLDLLAQIVSESSKYLKTPYAGFDDFCMMSRGNPRSLLIILDKIYSKCVFSDEHMFSGEKVSIKLQSLAILEASQFASNEDSSFGDKSEKAKISARRLAEMLRVARYSINIPEVSPLAITLSQEDLSEAALDNFKNAKHYYFLIESGVSPNRPDRNNKEIKTKVYLNPMWSPKWGLSIAVRGDLSLNKDLANAIFDPSIAQEKIFNEMLGEMRKKWGVGKIKSDLRMEDYHISLIQPDLFL